MTTPAASAEETVQVTASLLCGSVGEDGPVAYRVGVQLEMAPGWHVYWKHPGDAGLATTVELELPPGLRSNGLDWPLPSRFEQPGGLVGYGYEKSVVLAADLVVDGPAPPADDVVVRAAVSWLACKERCIPGSASLEGRLAGDATDAARLAEWRGRLPVPAATAESFRLSVTRGRNEGERTVWLSWRDRAPTVELFPDPGETLRVVESRVQTRAAVTRIDLELRPVGGASELTGELPAVLVLGEPDGSRRGYELSINLK